MKTNNSNGQLTAQVNLGDAQKSGFDLSNNVLGTGKLGRIYPTRALHVMPNDTINSKSQIAVQFEPLAVPILSNMHVKREEFYVPYNVVWQNWDKFISGGEKLDYKGVVPNTSMFDIVSNINGYLYGNNLLDLEIKVREGSGNTGASNYRGFSFSTISDLEDYANALREQLKTIGTQFGIEDILVEQREALDNFDKYADNWRARYGNADPAFDGLLFVTFYQSDYDNFNDMWSAYEELYHLTGNPAIDYLKEYIHERTADVGRIVLPTPLGLDYLTLHYDYFKSFIGAGSILDYLNMSRVTFKDYLYTWLQYLISEEFGEIGSGSIVTDTNIQLPALFVDKFSQNPLSILHLRANYCVWYNNYRDILLETTPIEPKNTDTIGSSELFTLLVPRQRCWEKDAFTTALDNPGTGNVGVPLTTNDMPVFGDAYFISKYNDLANGAPFVNVNGNNIAEITISDSTYRVPTSYLSGVNGLVENTFSSNGFSLYALDAAQRAQKWLQKALFFGNRISDFYYMRYGVRFLDARLRLPELLSSSTQLVKLDVVMNNTNITTEAGGEIYQSVAGDRSAYASAYDDGDGYSRFIEEHGVVLSYLTVMPDPTYAYGQSRDYSRLDQFDFAFNEFATLGMDAVYDTEITATPFSRQPLVFGYQGKYYDYKAKHSEEHGELLESQDMYTFGRRFDMFSQDGAPKLNYAFVHCFPPLDMFVVDSKLADYFRFDLHNSTTAERLLPAHSVYI